LTALRALATAFFEALPRCAFLSRDLAARRFFAALAQTLLPWGDDAVAEPARPRRRTAASTAATARAMWESGIRAMAATVRRRTPPAIGEFP
jgi:hypothetical protein